MKASASTKTAEADAFIDFMISPQAQELIAKQMHAPPLIRGELLDLDPATRAGLALQTTPIAINLEARRLHLDLMVTEFNKMLAS